MKNILKKTILILAVLIIGIFLICCKNNNKEEENMYSPAEMDNGFEPLEIVEEYSVELGEGEEGLIGAHD